MNASLLLKSGIPLVCCSSSRSVMLDQFAGSAGSHRPIVSVRCSVPAETRESATAPLKAFDTLAMRMLSSPRIGAPPATSATPDVCSVPCRPRCTTTAIPGGPPA